MLRKHCIFICLAGLLIVTWSAKGQFQTKEKGVLDQPVELVTIKEPNMLLALNTIAIEYRIPIGLEVMTTENIPSQPIDVSMQKGTLRELLNAVVAQDARYRWSIIDGVANVYPQTSRDELLMELLDTRIREFVLPKNTSLYRIRNSIVELPEIKSRLERAKVTPSVIAYTRVDLVRLSDFSMQVSNITLRELLNRIVAESQVKFWVLNRFGKSNEQLILNF